VKTLEKINGRLVEYGKKMYKINHQRSFDKLGMLLDEDKKECFDFAYEMAFGTGKHRNTRSGGKKKREPGEIFIDTFQGKAAEYTMYRYLLEYSILTTKPDVTIEGYGVWDSFDLEYGKIHMAVKSTKYYGHLLLLETKDWNEKGEYLPNIENGILNYDMFILIRISPDGRKEMKKRSILYSEQIERKVLEDAILSKRWEFDIAGFITNADFIKLIEKNYVLPQGALLSGTTPMDAENYYVQAGDMRSNKEMIERLQKYKLMFESGLTK